MDRERLAGVFAPYLL